MEPFTYNEENKIILCCQAGRVLDELGRHLEKYHGNIEKIERERIV